MNGVTLRIFWIAQEKNTEENHGRCAACVIVKDKASAKGIDQIYSSRLLGAIKRHIALSILLEHSAKVRVLTLEVDIKVRLHTDPLATDGDEVKVV